LGLGLSKSKQGKISAKSVVGGSAAAKSGKIAAGDVVVSIDGKEVAGLDVSECDKLLVGAEGTSVVVRGKRGDKGSVYEATLVRGEGDEAPGADGGDKGGRNGAGVEADTADRAEVHAADCRSPTESKAGASAMSVREQCDQACMRADAMMRELSAIKDQMQALQEQMGKAMDKEAAAAREAERKLEETKRLLEEREKQVAEHESTIKGVQEKLAAAVQESQEVCAHHGEAEKKLEEANQAAACKDEAIS
jgi:hypothetical protein